MSESRGSQDRFRELVLTAGGLGLLRPAPGTWGSLPPLLLAFALHAAGAPMPIVIASALLLGLAGAIGCVRFGRWAESRWGRTDPSSVVADEVAGQAIVVAAIPWDRFAAADGLAEPLGWCVAAFLLFRVFDIVKPPPIGRLQGLPHGWGVLIDDLAAGAAAAAMVLAGRFIW
ncbi:MAG: phosphatidylglycerophosphatase A [Phycisphaerales bacterium]